MLTFAQMDWPGDSALSENNVLERTCRWVPGVVLGSIPFNEEPVLAVSLGSQDSDDGSFVVSKEVASPPSRDNFGTSVAEEREIIIWQVPVHVTHEALCDMIDALNAHLQQQAAGNGLPGLPPGIAAPHLEKPSQEYASLNRLRVGRFARVVAARVEVDEIDAAGAPLDASKQLDPAAIQQLLLDTLVAWGTGEDGGHWAPQSAGPNAAPAGGFLSQTEFKEAVGEVGFVLGPPPPPPPPPPPVLGLCPPVLGPPPPPPPPPPPVLGLCPPVLGPPTSSASSGGGGAAGGSQAGVHAAPGGFVSGAFGGPSEAAGGLPPGDKPDVSSTGSKFTFEAVWADETQLVSRGVVRAFPVSLPALASGEVPFTDNRLINVGSEAATALHFTDKDLASLANATATVMPFGPPRPVPTSSGTEQQAQRPVALFAQRKLQLAQVCRARAAVAAADPEAMVGMHVTAKWPADSLTSCPFGGVSGQVMTYIPAMKQHLVRVQATRSVKGHSVATMRNARLVDLPAALLNEWSTRVPAHVTASGSAPEEAGEADEEAATIVPLPLQGVPLSRGQCLAPLEAHFIPCIVCYEGLTSERFGSFCFREFRITGDGETIEGPRHPRSVCKECLRRHAMSFLSEGRNFVNCPFPDCNRTLQTHELQNVIPRTAYSALIARIREAEANEAQEDTFGALEGIELRMCPKCRVRIEKNEGCASMNCYRCGAHFMWQDAQILQRQPRGGTPQPQATATSAAEVDPTADLAAPAFGASDSSFGFGSFQLFP